jgi:hypothetical protein
MPTQVSTVRFVPVVKRPSTIHRDIHVNERTQFDCRGSRQALGGPDQPSSRRKAGVSIESQDRLWPSTVETFANPSGC